MIRGVPDRIELRLPDPCLVVLIGAAGSGKSTLAARVFAPDEVLSSDTLRELIAGDAADQRATGAAFAALHRALARRLARRQLTVVDATSASARDRRPLLRAAHEAGIPSIAIVLDLPAAIVLARNADRPCRVVPEDAVRRHLDRVAASLRPPGFEAEGFARVLVLRDPGAVDALVVTREPAAPAEPGDAALPNARR
jgi:predicted kinase